MKTLNRKDRDVEVIIKGGLVCMLDGRQMKVKEGEKIIGITKQGEWAIGGERKSRIIRKYGKTYVQGTHISNMYDEEDLDMIARNKVAKRYNDLIEENVKGI